MPRLLRLGRIQSHPRGTTYSAGSRRCARGRNAESPPRAPRIFRRFSADFTRIFRGCKCTTLPGKVAKTYPRIFRGFTADFPRNFRGWPEQCSGPPADFTRVPRSPPADFTRVPRGPPADFPRLPRRFLAGPRVSSQVSRTVAQGHPVTVCGRHGAYPQLESTGADMQSSSSLSG